jgi:hypothetical protein
MLRSAGAVLRSVQQSSARDNASLSTCSARELRRMPVRIERIELEGDTRAVQRMTYCERWFRAGDVVINADLPFEGATVYELIVNRTTVRALGIAIPRNSRPR